MRFEEEEEDFREKFKRFLEDDVQYKKSGKLAMEKIDTIHSVISNIHRDTIHLQTLPVIANELTLLRKESFELIAGKKQVPLVVFFAVIATVCLIFLLRELGARPFDITPTSVKINMQKNGQVKDANP